MQAFDTVLVDSMAMKKKTKNRAEVSHPKNAYLMSNLANTHASTISEPRSGPAFDMQLHVKNVPQHCALETLLARFRQYGRIRENAGSTYIVTDKSSGASKGRAFVHFESLDGADEAIRELHKIVCLDAHSCPLEVEYKRGETERLGLPSDATTAGFENKLFVGNLPKDYNESHVQQMFKSYGPLREVRIVRDRNHHQQQSKGAAFVKLQSKEQALRAIWDFSSKPITLAKRKLEVRYAESRRYQLGVKQVEEPKDLVRLDSNVWKTSSWPGQPAATGYPGMAGSNNCGISNSMPALDARGGWVRVSTPEGKAYYVEPLTRRCQWNPPPEFLAGMPVFAAEASLTQPAGGPTGTTPVEPVPTRAVAGDSCVDLQRSPVVMISQLPPSWREQDLGCHFSQLGDAQEVRVATDNDGNSQCFGYIWFTHWVSAFNAVTSMNGHIVGEKLLRVTQVAPEAMTGLWPPPEA